MCGSGVRWGGIFEHSAQFAVAAVVTEATPRRQRERESAHAETLAIIKNGGAGVDGARTAIMVQELFGRWRAHSVVSCWQLIIDLLAKISLSARISLFASLQISLTPQISLFST